MYKNGIIEYSYIKVSSGFNGYKILMRLECTGDKNK